MNESTPTTYRIAGVQMAPAFAEPAANLESMLARLKTAADSGAKLVVFPECALTGYGFDTKEEARRYAEPLPGPSVATMAAACAKHGGVHVVYGLLEKDGDRVFNALALVGPNGLVGSYRKVHLPFLGVDRFADKGDRPFEVIDVDGLRIGMHICYDGGFPEPARVMTLAGADLLVLPTNWPSHAESAAEHMPACRAMENVVYFMAVNRIGEEKGFRFIGRSSIADPTGSLLAMASPDGSEIIFAEIDPARARTKRLIRVPGLHEVDRINDRRPEFYGPIAETHADRAERP